MPDLSDVTSREQMESLCRERYPDSTQGRISNFVGQLWTFRSRIQKNDLVVLPVKSRPVIAIGRITGDYKHRTDLPEDARHTRSTKWLRTDIPRSSVDQDLLYSLGAFMTVCQITRNDAEKRIAGLLEGKNEPGSGPEPEETLDIELYAQDQLKEFISRRFRGHDL